MVTGSAKRSVKAGQPVITVIYSVFRVNFMVKLLRACVWMPWRK